MPLSAVRRNTTDRVVAGVCGGAARHWGVDPLVVRVACVLLALSGGIGVVLYLAGWLLLAVDGGGSPAIVRLLGPQLQRWPRELKVILLLVVGVVASGVVGKVAPFGIGPAVIVALVWYFGYFRTRARRSSASRYLALSDARPPDPAPMAPATPFIQAATDWRQRIAHVDGTAVPSSGYPPYSTYLAIPDPVGLYVEPEPVPPVPTRVSRTRSTSARRLRLGALVVLGLALSGLGVADLRYPIPLAAYFAAALLVLGLTLVAAAWWGRALGILPVALLVMLATLATTVAGPVAEAQGWTSQQLAYTSPSQLLAGDQRQRGVLRVDLTRLPASSATSYTAHVGVGVLDVAVPADVQVEVRWRLAAGAMVVNGRTVQAGPQLAGVEQLAARDPKKRTLVLHLSVDRGVIQVRR